MKNKFKIILTIFLIIFSFYYTRNGIYFLKKNDKLMQEIESKKNIYNKNSTNAIITNNIMIPGKKGYIVDIDKSYKKMKKLNIFNESLLVYDEISPIKSINNIYDKVIIRGNDINNISIILNINDKNLLTKLNNILINNNVQIDIMNNINYCFTEEIKIDNKCNSNHQYTLLAININNYHLTNTKKSINKYKVFIYTFNQNNYNDLNLIIKYFKNNNYNIVTIDKLIEE